ncbi:hypothetical protein RJ640_013218 [Escallonia rubra]|uniref:RING-type E3 ubiquitin transferase n=1 Tax=Escallonia rubra TaxID=112253 RepID=A0AA88R3Z5_9ASTE|nr:hypothetical protein RJ640_013218 [Escallonia rubra]
MEEAFAADGARYWCHMCHRAVDPIMEVAAINCPLCQSGFVEEMESTTTASRIDHPHHHRRHSSSDFGGGGSDSDHALSLWAPILLGMMRNPRRRSRMRRLEYEEDDDDENRDGNNDSNINNHFREGETELDRELESIIRRRRRSSATILHLLQGIRAGILSESENAESENNSNRDRDGNRVILINPFNQTIIVQGSYGSNSNESQNPNQRPIGSLGDYFIGPGLDLLLQHLAENDPNRYGTPPAQKEAVEAMPTVKIGESVQCSVCLEDFDIGAEAKEMPCKHRFHSGCILPWLELHSSCPVCRYQMPSDESKLDLEGHRNNTDNSNVGENNGGNNSSGEEGDAEGRNGSGRRFSVPLPWPLSSFFSSTGSQTSNGNSSSSSSSSGSSRNARGSASHTDEN